MMDDDARRKQWRAHAGLACAVAVVAVAALYAVGEVRRLLGNIDGINQAAGEPDKIGKPPRRGGPNNP